MIKIANVQFWVHDQDEALRFYTKTLGWEVRPTSPWRRGTSAGWRWGPRGRTVSGSCSCLCRAAVELAHE